MTGRWQVGRTARARVRPNPQERRAEEARIKRRIEALRQELAAKASGSGPTEELPPAAAPAAQEAP